MQPFRLSTLCYIIWIGILSSSQSYAQETFLQEKKADSLFAAWNSNTPGLSMALVKEGRLVYNKGYGMANIEYDAPVTVTTPFHAASLSKQFTAFCILLLQEKGLLSLDDDIHTYIPELPAYGKTITLRHLATHTSGLRDQWRLLEMAGWRLDDIIRKEQVLALICKQRSLNFAPGEKFMYSNTGYTLLAEVVARVSGIPFGQFAQENIFSVLKMDHTFFNDDYERPIKNRAYSYHKEKEGYKKSILNYSITGATSLFTTAADLAQWALLLNAPPERYKNAVKLLNTQARLTNGDVLETALGQYTGVTFHGMEWFDHSGSDAGFRSYLGRFPEHNAAVIVLANSIPVNANGLALSLADIFLGEYYQPKPKTASKPVFEHDPQKFIKSDLSRLSLFCGKYWQPDDWYNREIQLINDTLTYIRPGGVSSKLLPVSANECKMLGDKEDVSVFFSNNPKGEWQMQMVINNGKPLSFVKYQNVDLAVYKGDYYSDELGASFQLLTKNQKLYAYHMRLGEFELTPVTPTLFTSANRNFRKITVQQDAHKKITGIIVDNDGATGMVFLKK